ncbi:primosomal protein N' [Ravibacter arvi]|uniref:Replication restart protein PriA n=1 Tax=Ravibacter arvi TaxID=2051041 RepID=A0ABP8LVV5_9BACT
MNQESLFEEEITLFADVILPVPVPRLFTYRVPREMSADLVRGCRVVVQFGKNRVLTALVERIHDTPPTHYTAKYILELLDQQPLVTSFQIALFKWMAEYYMCAVGEVFNVALPSGLKITNQSKIQFNPDFDYPELLTQEESFLMEEVKRHGMLTYEELGRLAERKNVTSLIKSLISKRAIIIFEEIKEKYQPKTIAKIRLASPYQETEKLEELVKSIEKNTKQLDIIFRYLSYQPVFNNPELNLKGVEKSIFTQSDSLSASALATLIRKGIFEQFEAKVSRIADAPPTEALQSVELSPGQQKASEQIHELFKEKSVVLLHGITGSGKTEVFIDLISKALRSDVQVLYLLPEIALTTQIVSRLQKVFGNKMGIYHSKFSDNERVEVWKGLVEGKFQFVIGVRSAIFLPFDNLGLIIVDEEHESSYKQYDPAPRYHARDVAVMLGFMHKAKVLLGSATPSLESYYNARSGQYGLVTMTERYGAATLPDFVLIDMKQEKKKGNVKEEFSTILLDSIKKNIQNGEQSILFQNRRGYAPWLQCEDCDWISACQNCDVTLTYHMREAELRCHYCGHREAVPRTCPHCGSARVRTMGYGTEKIESQLEILVPEVRVQRMDLDTTRSKNAYSTIIRNFEENNVDVLVGTQMVTKGLDFDNVSMVGVFDVDRLINFPEFRATERAFQLMTQVSGRAGRRAKTKGKVLIQTSNPGQEILQWIIAGDYNAMYQTEIAERAGFGYPPFTRLIKLTVKHEDLDTALQAAKILAAGLTEQLGKTRVLGPEAPLVNRVRNRFLLDILIKLEREKVNFRAVKSLIQERVNEILADKTRKHLQIVIDVDPA